MTVVNPLSAMPFYRSLTENHPDLLSRSVALRACIAAFVAMLFFAVFGKFIFSFFSVSVDGLRVVGGILFMIMGYDMLQGKESRTKSVSASERFNAQDIKIKAITPLAIPLITGPGTITFMTVRMHESHTLTQKSLLLICALLVAVSSYYILLSSQKIMDLIGESGQKVFIRLMGLILMMIAVEYFFTGLKPYIRVLVT